MKRITPWVALAGILFGLASSNALAQQCPATSAVEQMLCNNPALRELDNDLQAAQREYRKAEMIGVWRERIASTCGTDVECLMRAYLDELAHTQRILVTTAQKQLAQANACQKNECGAPRGSKDPAVGKPVPAISPQGKSPEEVFAIASRSIVLVAGYGTRLKVIEKSAHGSGVTIAANRVATNCHLVSDMDRLYVAHDGISYPAKLLLANEQTDICILHVDNLPAQPATLRPLAEVRQGQRIYAVGNPRNIGLNINDGLLSAIVDGERVPELRLHGQLLHFDARNWPGNSGGGLFDEQGRVIGIPTKQLRSGKDQPPMNFAVPLAEVAAVKRVLTGL